MRRNHDIAAALARLIPVVNVCIVVMAIASGASSQENTSTRQLEAAATASLGGPASAQAQLEQDRLRRLQDSRLPSVDLFFYPFEQ